MVPIKSKGLDDHKLISDSNVLEYHSHTLKVLAVQELSEGYAKNCVTGYIKESNSKSFRDLYIFFIKQKNHIVLILAQNLKRI